MTVANVYLNFDGNCEEAFEFYKSVFGGEFPYIGRYKAVPPQEGMPPIPAEMGEKIMHISLPISKETMIMGSGVGGEWGPPIKPRNNLSISLSTASKEEANR